MNFKEELTNILVEVIDLPKEEIFGLIEIPSDSKMGDYALPCFTLAKTLKKAPNIIASELKEKIGENKYFERIESVGPYLNFFIDKDILRNTVVNRVKEEKEEYGKSDYGKNRNVVIDYSSPNIAKPFHIGHIRTTLLGNALYRIAKRIGFNSIGVNHLGDYGTQFGMLIAAYKKWGNKEDIEKNPMGEFLKLYVRMNKEIEEDPEKRKIALDWFKKLEENDPEVKEIWKWMRDLSIKEFKKVYERLGINFESYNGEAFYQDMLPKVVNEMREKNVLTKSEGCEIIKFDDNTTPLIVTKSNGTTTYATRDVATAEYRYDKYHFYKNLYVVATEQNLHFKQLFKTLQLLGYDWAKDCEHISFGMVSIEDGALSTRKGQVLYLEDVLNKAVEKTLEIIEERNPNLPNKEKVAKQVGIGAIKFQEFYNQRIKDYVFSWDKTLSFEGETGPYVQYTYARANSVIEKSGIDVSYDDIKTNLLIEEEVKLLKEIYKFPEIIIDSFNKYEPYLISRQIMEIVKEFNRYYYNNPINTDDEELKKHRLGITLLVKTVIKSGLSLLGIETPEKM